MKHCLRWPLLRGGVWTALLSVTSGGGLAAQGTPLSPPVDSLAAEAEGGDADSQYRYGLVLERGAGIGARSSRST